MSRTSPVLWAMQKHGADATCGEALGAVGELVMDVGGGHHGLIAFGLVTIRDPLEEPLPPLAEEPAVAFPSAIAVAVPPLLGDSSSHSKTSVAWNSEDVFVPQLFHKLRGFSSFFPRFGRRKKNITLVVGRPAGSSAS